MAAQAEAANNGDHAANSSLAHIPPPRKSLMASRSNRKKQRNTGDNHPHPQPNKKLKSSTVKVQRRDPPNFPPEFWDGLLEISLTPRALREFDRRVALEDLPPPTSAGDAALRSIPTVSIARFARHGGPDITDLRNFPDPQGTTEIHSSHSLSMATSSAHKPKSKRSSAYDQNFERNLIQNNIYPVGHRYKDGQRPRPKNIDEINQRLSMSRDSLSPTRMTSPEFEEFQDKGDRVLSESKVMRDIMAIIHGNCSIVSEDNLRFTNLESITAGATVSPAPDVYDGVAVDDIPDTIRDDLDKVIIPSHHNSAPAIPNFFLEVKSPKGGADVAKRQACLDGAVGARAIHHLLNYKQDDQVYDGNAYSLSSTYHAGTGTLQMFAHFMSASDTVSEPEYHMRQIDGWQLTGNINSFRRGLAAFRNARDLAKEFRETALRSAIGRISDQSPKENSEASSEWQNAHDLLQNQIADHDDSSNDESNEGDTQNKEEDEEDDENDENDEPQLSQLSSHQAMEQYGNSLKRASNKIS